MSLKKLAIVTGASSGIGEQIAKILRKDQDLELWLIARREDRLKLLCEGFESNHPGQCRIFMLDLGLKESWQSLEDAVAQEAAKNPLTVAWLVNNAGFGKSTAFKKQSLTNLDDMIELNIKALTNITRRMIPYMSSGSKILNVASTAAFLPIPGMAAYAASKAYVLHFSLALREELKGAGISVSALCPGPVATEFIDIASMPVPMKALVEDATHTAFLAVEKASQGKAIILSGFIGWVARFAAAILPRTVVTSLSALSMKAKGPG